MEGIIWKGVYGYGQEDNDYLFVFFVVGAYFWRLYRVKVKISWRGYVEGDDYLCK